MLTSATSTFFFTLGGLPRRRERRGDTAAGDGGSGRRSRCGVRGGRRSQDDRQQQQREEGCGSEQHGEIASRKRERERENSERESWFVVDLSLSLLHTTTSPRDAGRENALSLVAFLFIRCCFVVIFLLPLSFFLSLVSLFLGRRKIVFKKNFFHHLSPLAWSNT